MPDSVGLHFIRLEIFERSAASAGVSDDDVAELEQDLIAAPTRGALMAGTGGVRKIRVSVANSGKSGGARVIYYYVSHRSVVYFIAAFAKNVQENLNASQKKAVKALTAMLNDKA